jgi:hypothetical protein
MPDQKIIDYIKSQLGLGIDINKIRNDLLMNGSLPSEIDLAFNSFNNTQNSNIPTSNISSSVFTEQPARPSILKKTLITASVFILLGVVTVGAYIGYNYVKDSQITLGSAFLNTIEAFSAGKIKSGEFIMSAEITAKDVGKNYSDLAPDAKEITSQFQDVAAKFIYSGIVSKDENDKFETSGDISASIKNPTGGSLGMFDPQELALKYKTFSDNIYLNIQSIPSVASMIIPVNIDISKYLNQWFSIPSTMAEQTSRSFDSDFTASGTRNLATTTISTEVKTQILGLLDNSGAFTVVDRRGEKTDKGTEVTALYLKIDWDKLGDEIIRISKESAEKNNSVPYTKSEELELRANIEKMKEIPTSNDVLKALVGNDDYLYGYIATGDLMDKDNKQLGSYKVSFVADNFNKDFVIDRPTNARSFTEVMNEINTLMMSPKKK